MHFFTSEMLLLAIIGLSEQQDSSRAPKICGSWSYKFNLSGTFNSNTEKCCFGTILSKATAKGDKCCGASVYDSSKELCCEHQATPSQAGHACCGSRTFNPDTSICCRKQVFDVSGDDGEKKNCCGDKVYDVTTQTCCRYNGVYIVHDNREGYACCWDEYYNVKTQVCCTEMVSGIATSRFIVTKNDSSHGICCGRTLINSRLQSCCKGKPIDKNTQGCCHGQVYDYENELCCSTGTAKKTDPAQDSCCQDTPYNSKKELCCGDDDKVITKTGEADNDCCGDITWNIYDPKQRCCVNKLVDNALNCCGSDIYNKTKELCCVDPKTLKDKVVDKGTADGNVGCCNLQVYNKDKQVCCFSRGEQRIIDRVNDTSNDVDCCGLETYNSKTQLCCRDYSNSTFRIAVADKPKGDENQIDPVFGCCNLKAYQYSTEMCCGDKIVPKTENNDCCGSKVYETDKEMCCLKQLVPLKEGHDSCCFYGTSDYC